MKKFAIIILVMLSCLAACEKQTQKPNNTSGCFDISDGTPLIKTTYSRLHYAAYEYDNFNRIIKETRYKRRRNRLPHLCYGYTRYGYYITSIMTIVWLLRVITAIIVLII